MSVICPLKVFIIIWINFCEHDDLRSNHENTAIIGSFILIADIQSKNDLQNCETNI